MEGYQQRAFFREHDDPTVSGFTVIESDDDQYRIAEKWNRPDGNATWTTYWVHERELQDRIDAGACEYVGKVSEEQFRRIVQNTDERALNPVPA